jgi:hypothetical protein
MDEKNETSGRAMLWTVRIVAGLAVFGLSFWLSLFAIDYWAARSRDALRAEHIALIRSWWMGDFSKRSPSIRSLLPTRAIAIIPMGRIILAC